MSNFTASLFVSVFGVALVGCTTVTKPVPLSAAIAAPSDRLYAFQERSTASDGILVVTRDKGFGCYMAFYVNGKLAARLDNAETAKFYVTPGELVLRYGRDPEGKALCGTMQDYWSSHETTLSPGETKHYRLTIIKGGKTEIQRAD